MWKSVGLESDKMMYEASTGGEIRSVLKTTGATKLLSTHLSSGYLVVNMADSIGQMRVHNLVALAHLPKPTDWNESCTPNHKNRDKLDNRADNLEWATSSEQSFDRRPNSRGNVDSCPIVGIHVWDGSIVKFESALIAELCYDNIHHSGISMCLNGKRKTHGNYIWVTPMELPDLPEERWEVVNKDIPKYSISVSTYGRISYKFKHGYIKKVSSQEKMSERLTDETDRYPGIIIKNKPYQLHRVIWEAFIGKIPDNMIINHINHDKQDAKLSNLELTTQSGNVSYAYNSGKYDETKSARKKMSIDGVIYESELQASKMLGISRSTISGRIKNKKFTYYFLVNS